MPRTPAPWLPSTLRHVTLLVGLLTTAWVADLCGRAWLAVPQRAAEVLLADRDVMHVDDLPPGGLALVLFEREPGAEVARTLLAGDELPDSLAAMFVAERLDEDTQLLVWLNTVPVRLPDGRVVRGLDTAAREAFGTSISQLEIAELRMLVERVDLAAC